MRNRSLALVLAAGFALACGGGDDGGGPSGGTNTLSKESGDIQTGTVNTQLASDFCVKVTESGSAVSGVAVTWSTLNGGTLTPPSSTTPSSGIACSRLTLGTGAGAQTAQAAATGATGSPVSFSATANAGNATELVKAGGDNQTAPVNTDLPEELGVRVIDAFGNGVTGALVTWLISSGSATIDPSSGNTTATGLAATTLTVGAAPGPIIITASSAGLVGSPQTFTATGSPVAPPPSAITIAVSNNQFTPNVDTVAVGGTVTWTWGNTGGIQHSVTTTGSPSFTSDPAGATASPHSYGPITFANPGTYFYYCTVHGAPGSPPTGMSGTIVVM